MCLIAFAIQAKPDCPLLLAGNRDEFFERPTAALHRWHLPDGVEILGGRDLRDGGTWLGVSGSGRVAMLTNVRSPGSATGTRSRGELPLLWLRAGASADELQHQIDPGAYGGFNLVVGDLSQGCWSWLSNCNPLAPHSTPGHALHHRSALAPGVYTLSNASLDTPWPKARRLKAAMVDALAAQDHGEQDGAWMLPLTEALSDRSPVPPDELPETGVPFEWERVLASPFVSHAERGYGTRSSTVIRVLRGPDPSAGWQLDMCEWHHTPDTPAAPHHWSRSPPSRETLRG